MSNNLSSQLSNLSNDELVTAFENLKKACKKIRPKINFGDKIKKLPPFNRRTYDDATIGRYINSLKVSRDIDYLEKERTYIISLIEAACIEWKIEKTGGNDFIRSADIERSHVVSNDSFRYAGNYFLYCPTSNQNSISRHPLHISVSGTARIVFSKRGNGTKDILEGEASYDGHSILTISFFSEMNIPKFKHYMFSVANLYPQNLKNAYGVSIRTNQDNCPIGRMEILITTNDNVDNPAVVYKDFKIDSEEFREEDTRRGGLLSWLTGKLNRLIVVPSKPNNTYSIRMSEYKDIHFYAACYQAMKEKYEDSLTYLYQAYLHGFNNIELMEEEISSGGRLAALYKLPLTAVPTHSKDHHVAFSCRELVDKIRSRAEHIRLLPPTPKKNNEYH